MRFKPIHEPFIKPYLCIASIVYWEQLGVYLQVAGFHLVER